MTQDTENIDIIKHTRSKASSLIRQWMVLEILGYMGDARQKIRANRLLSKTMIATGSVTLPPALRRAADLDVTIQIDSGVFSEIERMVLPELLKNIAHEMEAQSVISDEDALKGNKTIDYLQRRRGFLTANIVKTLRAEDIPAIKESLLNYGFSTSDLSVLDDFSAIAKASVHQRGNNYKPTKEELAGTELVEAVAVEFTTVPRERPNLPKPIILATLRDKPMPPVIAFANPYEEAADKIFALTMSKDRAQLPYPRTKDLLDLYIRTHGPAAENISGFAEYKIQDMKRLVDLVRLMLPEQQHFYDQDLYFSKIDSRNNKVLKQVKEELLALSESGVIGDGIFEEAITTKTVNEYAKRLVENAQKTSELCFGVHYEGSATSPIYRLAPPPTVKAYWDACKLMSAQFAVPLTKPRDKHTRANFVFNGLKERAAAMLEAEYPPNEKEKLIASGIVNAFFGANPEIKSLDDLGIRLGKSVS